VARSFMIGTLSVREKYATKSSWHFEVLIKDLQYPNVASLVGSIDVHYPCKRDIRLHATVCFDVEHMAVESEEVPTMRSCGGHATARVWRRTR
jgi:hypothetical protein